MSNREILFRGKNKKGEWIEGYLSWENEISYKNTDVCAGSAYFDGTDFYTVKSCVINPKTLGQFTGLTDVNGTKIFEGDIVHLYVEKNDIRYPHIVDYNGLVVFKDGGFCVIDGVPENYSFRRYAFSNCGLNCEVIGNIYDNPELLEESEQE